MRKSYVTVLFTHFSVVQGFAGYSVIVEQPAVEHTQSEKPAEEITEPLVAKSGEGQ